MLYNIHKRVEASGAPGDYVRTISCNATEIALHLAHDEMAVPASAPPPAAARQITYAHRRAAEYPTLADQLDAFWKGGEAAEAMRERVLAVKAKFPKDPTP